MLPLAQMAAGCTEAEMELLSHAGPRSCCKLSVLTISQSLHIIIKKVLKISDKTLAVTHSPPM